VRSPYALFNKLGAKTCEFRILQTVKLYLISAEINNKSKLIARLLVGYLARPSRGFA
jgi:hypothetical protein